MQRKAAWGGTVRQVSQRCQISKWATAALAHPPNQHTGPTWRWVSSEAAQYLHLMQTTSTKLNGTPTAPTRRWVSREAV